MKKIICLLLVAMMSVSLCACGGQTPNNTEGSNNASNTSNEETKEVRIEEDFTPSEDLKNPSNDVNTYDYAIFISKSELKNRLKKVTLTKDNWQEYFGYYEYTEHIVEKNAFGDIENEYDVVHKGFGGEKIVALNNVAFKFASRKLIKGDGTEEILYPEGKDYFLIEMNRSSYDTFDDINKGYSLYEESECIDVIGEIIVWDLDVSTLDTPSLYLATPEEKMIFTTTGIGQTYSWDVFLKFCE